MEEGLRRKVRVKIFQPVSSKSQPRTTNGLRRSLVPRTPAPRVTYGHLYPPVRVSTAERRPRLGPLPHTQDWSPVRPPTLTAVLRVEVEVGSGTDTETPFFLEE